LFRNTLTRRGFLASLAGLVPWLAAGPRLSRGRLPHPAPRPGIDASHVLTADALGGDAGAIRVFDMIRQIPQVADGIRCQCECADLPDKYSLLSCFEGDGMAQHCHICQGVARLVYRLHKQGKTLDEIRAAVDERDWG
jgi:hypothetical protein